MSYRFLPHSEIRQYLTDRTLDYERKHFNAVVESAEFSILRDNSENVDTQANYASLADKATHQAEHFSLLIDNLYDRLDLLPEPQAD